ncbi:MAG: protein kinase, partial [Verrucomicrobiota bacterium]|nr:protein kinase [Verrucomicrobiota bacterium]
LLTSRRKLSIGQATIALLDILAGLEYAWDSARALHLDLKPENILLQHDLIRALQSETKDGFNEMLSLVSDWGIASVKEQRLGALLKSTASDPGAMRTMNNVGTLAYMAPERFVQNRRSSIASDVFALGIIYLELVTGRLPFTDPANAGIELVTKAYLATAKSALLDCQTEENAARFILWCIDPDPTRRPREYAEVRSALESCGNISVTPTRDERDPSAFRGIDEFARRPEVRRAVVATKAEYVAKQLANLSAVGRHKESPILVGNYFFELIEEWALTPDDSWALCYIASQAITFGLPELGIEALEAIIKSRVAEENLDLTRVYVDLGRLYHQLRNDPQREMWCYEQAVSAVAPKSSKFPASVTDKARCHLFAASRAYVILDEARGRYHEAALRELRPDIDWDDFGARIEFLKSAAPGV